MQTGRRRVDVLAGPLIVGLAVGLPLLAEAAPNPVFVQTDYRWRNDNGSEVAPPGGADWRADTNTPIVGVKRGENIRLRFAVRQTEDATGSLGCVLQYASSTDGLWVNVARAAGGGSPFVMALTAGYTNGEPTTAQLGSGGAFVPGNCVEAPEDKTVVTNVGLNYVNLEYCFQATPEAVRNQTYYFRLTKAVDGTALNQYDVYAGLTIEDADYTNLPVFVSSLAPQDLTRGVGWSYPIQASGLQPIAYGAGDLPEGIVLSGNVLSGVPLEEGSFPVTLTASNVSGVTTGVLTLNIAAPGSGLRPGANEIQVTLGTGSTTTVTLNLANLGPDDIEWAIHVQGGTAPGGTAGAIDRTFVNPLYYHPLYGPFANSVGGSVFTYRDHGTADTADDEIWLDDYTSGGDTLTRRSVASWEDLGRFEDLDSDIGTYCQFALESDRYWTHPGTIGGAPGLALVDVATGSEVRRFGLTGTPLTGWVGLYAVHPHGVVYQAAYGDTEGYGDAQFTMWESRARDGRLIAGHGALPAMESATMLGTPQFHAGYPCWKDGHFWFYGGANEDTGKVKLWRWAPGMGDAVMALEFSTGNTIKYQKDGVMCPAVESGFVWVCTSEMVSPYIFIHHVDTGYRPWLKPMEPTGTLANGGNRSVTVQIDASTAPTGTYHAVLAITQYPQDDVPQILLPVTLTVTSGGAPSDTDGDGMLDSWEITYLGGTSAAPTGDADSDRMNNLSEFLAGTNPTNANSVLSILDSELQISNSELVLRWLSVTGKTYRIEKSTNLTAGFTTVEVGNIVANPPTNSHAVTLGSGGSGFYRVRLYPVE